ncbi:pseudouridine synthase [Crocinitomicaceae bacterium]|nr:pseudouridine synthase [Crocinitomicaceae bacterium]
METKRLNKAIAETGYCSRRAADKLIEEGIVMVNNKKVGLGVQVSSSDIISVNGKVITKVEEQIYLVFNKPTGITCTTDLDIQGNIISFLDYPKRIFPIGRLDKPSEGLIFLTNDGDIVNKILRSRNNHEKEYVVGVNKKVTDWFLKKMSSGLPILETTTKKCTVEKIDDYSFRIILTQGLNRQIRRMCEYLDFEVRTLKRIRIMNVELGSLKKGKYRRFTAQEFSDLQELINESSETEEAS